MNMASPTTSSIESTHNLAIDTKARNVACQTMKAVFGMDPYDWQLDVIAHMLKTATKSRPVPPAPIFLSQPTGGGKSLCRDTFAAARRGITWSISPLLSLSADQESKLEMNVNVDNANIIAIHLDAYRSESEQRGIASRVSKLSLENNATIVIFSSPQAMKNSSIFLDLYNKVIDKETLVLVVVDEAHLFVQFGLWFRDEFIDLKDIFFKPLLAANGKETKVPVLFMTATPTATVVSQIEQMTGLHFNQKRDIFWPDSARIRRRNLYIQVKFSNRVRDNVHAQVKSLYRDCSLGERKQWILFSNSRLELESLHPRINKLLDENGYPGDVILITGDMRKEQKFFYTKKFLSSPKPNDSTTTEISDIRLYDALGCLATRSLGGAGWDGPNVFLVMSTDLPTSVLSAAQEKGRAGRRPNASFETDRYLVLATLDSYQYLLRRIHLPPDAESDYKASDSVLSLDKYQKQQEDDLLDLLDVFVLPRECLHAAIERRLANPYIGIDNLSVDIPGCETGCDFCVGAYDEMLPKVVHSGLKALLLDIFIGADAIKDPTLNQGLVEALRNYPDAQKVVFGSKAKVKPEPRTVRRLILMLISSRILTHKIVYDDIDTEKKNPIVHARLNSGPDRIPFVFMDSSWEHIPSKDPIN